MSGLSEKNWDSCWPAPAKLNLFLHVVRRRADGYHLLQTLFRFIDYGDELRFSPRPDGRIVLATPLPGVAPDDDLTVRAARLLQQATGCRNGANIHLDKRLPMGAGLGGGSSDAATTLLALNHLWNLDLNRQTLQTLGLKLGADVPVFVFGRNALAGGIGEALRAVDLPPAWYVLIEPPVHVPTAAIFGDAALRRDTSPIDLARWHHGQTLPGHEPEHNDLEAVAVARYPLIGEAIRALSAHAPARMSGSGASVFAELADEKAAQAIAAALSENWQGKWPVRAVQGLAQHPLRTI